MSDFRDAEWYKCRVEPDSGFDESGNKGTPFIKVDFMVLEGDMGGMVIPGNFYVTPDTVDRLRQTLEVLGFDPKSDNLHKLSSIITGKEVEVQTQIQEFKGTRKVRANKVRAPRTGDQAGGLVAKIASLLGNEGTQEPIAGSVIRPDRTDDGDVPF